MSNIERVTEVGSVKDSDLNTVTTVVYAMQGIGYFFVITIFVAIIMNYVKRADTRGTLYESHFRWQIRTFWFSCLWLIIGICTSPFLIGYLVLFANWVWGIYRIVKGWLNLNDRKPMYV